MRKFLYLASVLLLAPGLKAATPVDDSIAMAEKQYSKFVDSVKQSEKWESGLIHLSGGKADINVPAGFKFLNAAQSKYILTDLWGNPPSVSDDILGMIFPANADAFDSISYAFVVRYENIGYVKDYDASKINYDDLLKDIQKEEVEANTERVKNGYQPIHMMGWAQSPFYDKENKVLHWAREIKFGEDTPHTLNYEIRILGRDGVLSMNAICTMNELPLVKADIDKVLQMAKFTSGNAYKDFDPKIDKVAAYTIGGLIAGKVLAKVGFFALLVKFGAAFWKFILLGFVALGGFIRKLFTGKKEKNSKEIPAIEEDEKQEDEKQESEIQGHEKLDPGQLESENQDPEKLDPEK
ncbi:DUF2167 domain-containing protein [Chitinophaga sp. LS1]|uniref:DUF2167 domain-containing protein n=1 Tax=Chitinophaga sp. LS1 TaxID=3051176 RepID=UPI002AABA7F9|nr:DUF2167 domain-containing protein [Chitinophaga sp. LS1]WPV65261.1 DUF2167 domain-containing protein [Chitinophaga sp. LS1]